MFDVNLETKVKSWEDADHVNGGQQGVDGLEGGEGGILPGITGLQQVGLTVNIRLRSGRHLLII